MSFSGTRIAEKNPMYKTGSAQWFIDQIKVNEFSSFEYRLGRKKDGPNRVGEKY